jgi:hypothetical protein
MKKKVRSHAHCRKYMCNRPNIHITIMFLAAKRPHDHFNYTLRPSHSQYMYSQGTGNTSHAPCISPDLYRQMYCTRYCIANPSHSYRTESIANPSHVHSNCPINASHAPCNSTINIPVHTVRYFYKFPKGTNTTTAVR